MRRTLYAACAAGALALAPVAASAQYVTYGTYGAYPYAAPYAPYAYSPNWAAPSYGYGYPETARQAWGYSNMAATRPGRGGRPAPAAIRLITGAAAALRITPATASDISRRRV